MRVAEQTTLAGSAAAIGVGLHSGEEARLTLKPAVAGAGIRMRRTDLGGNASETTIPACADYVADTRLGVRLQNAAGVSMMTVEHLMAALALAGVDNVLAEVSGPEIPIFDGSAKPFLDLIAQAGVKSLSAEREAFEICAALRVEDGDRFVEVVPAEGRSFEVSIDYPDRAIGRQTVAFSLDDGATPLSRLAPARTFCSLRDVETMRAAGFSRGGSLENAIVVDGDRLLNDTGLRDPQEFVLHKALDLIGDLNLAGAPIHGRIRAHKPGHDLNTRLARAIACDAAAAARRAMPMVEERERLTA